MITKSQKVGCIYFFDSGWKVFDFFPKNKANEKKTKDMSFHVRSTANTV